MSKKTILFSICSVMLLVLVLVSLSCIATPVTLTTPTVTKTLPVTQTLTKTSSVISTVTTISSTTVTTTVTATTTAPPATVTATVIPPPVTTTRPPLTVTQYWPPSTSFLPQPFFYYLPPLTTGQTVNFTFKSSGPQISYFVRDPASVVILTGKTDSVTLTGSGSFTASISGVYGIEATPPDTAIAVFTLSFYMS